MVSLADGAEVGEVRHALAMAGGVVVAQMGNARPTPNTTSRGDGTTFSVGAAIDNDRNPDAIEEWELGDDEDGDWEVISRDPTRRSLGASLGRGARRRARTRWITRTGRRRDRVLRRIRASSDSPPFRWCSAVAAGARFAARAARSSATTGGALLDQPLVPSMFPRWNERTQTLVISTRHVEEVRLEVPPIGDPRAPAPIWRRTVARFHRA